MSFSFLLCNEKATFALAKYIAPHLEAGDVVALYGTLGVGKSAFARALIQSLTSPLQEVPSPTFTLVQIYEPPFSPPLWHFDLYRLDTGEEALELGIEDAFLSAISLIEWPERLGTWLPLSHLRIELQEGVQENERQVSLNYSGKNLKLHAVLKELQSDPSAVLGMV